MELSGFVKQFIVSRKLRLRLPPSGRWRKGCICKYFCIITIIAILQAMIQIWKNHNICSQHTLLEKSILDPAFAGSSICGNSSCFGTAMCHPRSNLKVYLNRSSSRIEHGWYLIGGSTTSQYNLVDQVTFKVRFEPPCAGASCSVHPLRDIFVASNYRSAICRRFGERPNCDVTKMLAAWPRLKRMLAMRGRLVPDVINEISPPFSCASPRLADRIVRRVYDVRNKGTVLLKNYNAQEKTRLLLLCKLSPGTVVQQLFPHREGWLFESTIGRCGNIVIQRTAVEHTLIDVYNWPWKVRLDIAIQLLDLAYHYSDNDSRYLLLFHRLRANDLGISKRGKLRIKNADRILIVDQHYIEQEKPRGYERPIETRFDKDKLSIVENGFCGHTQNDANFYIVCRHFLRGNWKDLNGATLEGGLLHDPQELGTFTNKMYVLLDICTRGSVAIPNGRKENTPSIRRLAASHLRSLLLGARQCGPEYAYRYPECKLIDRSSSVYLQPDSFELQWF